MGAEKKSPKFFSLIHLPIPKPTSTPPGKKKSPIKVIFKKILKKGKYYLHFHVLKQKEMTDGNSLEVKPFDSLLSVVYKYALAGQKPAKFFITRPVEPEDLPLLQEIPPPTITPPELLQELQPEEDPQTIPLEDQMVNLPTIYGRLKRSRPLLQAKDLLFSLWSLYVSPEDFQALEVQSPTEGLRDVAPLERGALENLRETANDFYAQVGEAEDLFETTEQMVEEYLTWNPNGVPPAAYQVRDFVVLNLSSEIERLKLQFPSASEIFNLVDTIETPVDKRDLIFSLIQQYGLAPPLTESEAQELLEPLNRFYRDVGYEEGLFADEQELRAAYAQWNPERAIDLRGEVLWQIYHQLHLKNSAFTPLDFVFSYLETMVPRDIMESNEVGDYLIEIGQTEEGREYLDELRQTINNFYYIQEPERRADKYQRNVDMVRAYQSWQLQLREEAEADWDIARQILDFQQEIEPLYEETPFEFGSIVKKSEHVVYKMYHLDHGDKIQPADGFGLFDNSILGEHVPFIQYNTGVPEIPGKSFYKLYRGKSVDKEPNYQYTIVSPDAETELNSLYLKIWIRHPYEPHPTPMHAASANAFLVAHCDLEAGEISFDIPYIKDQPDDLDEYLQRVQAGEVEVLGTGVYSDFLRPLTNSITEYLVLDAILTALPVRLADRTEEGLKAEVSIYGRGLEIDPATFAYAVSLDPLLRNYLYIEESTHPQSLKKKLNIRYRPYPLSVERAQSLLGGEKRTLSATIHEDKLPVGSTYAVVGVSEEEEGSSEPQKQIKVVEDTDLPVITLNISRTSNIDIVQEFLQVAVALLWKYATLRPEILDIYSRLMGERAVMSLLGQEMEEEEVFTRFTDREEDIIPRKLKDVLPDLFKGDFSRRCQKKMQPMVIQPSQVERWKQQTFIYKGQTYQREVMPYPKPRPGVYPVYLVCPSDAYPFLGVKTNNARETKDKYPYIPCCYTTPQMETRVEGGKITGYQKYYLGLGEEEPKVSKAENVLKTNKTLPPGGMGQIASDIEEILKQYPLTAPRSDFRRYGVPRSPNSLLHSVLTAIKDPEYASLTEEAAKEDYVRRVRLEMARRLEKSLYKQELYDRSLEEISTLLEDVEVFLDPSLFYRGLEVMFGINLYVYGYDDNEVSEMVLPRHKIFHTQPYRALPTVLILKNWGGEADALEYPQCELIVEEVLGSNPRTIFDASMGKINYDTWRNFNITIRWGFVRERGRWTFQAHGNQYSEVQDAYSIVDYPSLVGEAAQYQILDTYGKMRGLIFEALNPQLREPESVTMIFEPSQPANLPLAADGPLQRCRASTAQSVFGDPSAVTKNSDGLVDGLWFGEDPKIYVPILKATEFTELPLGDANPIETNPDTSTRRREKLEKDLNFIQQLVGWLYLIARQNGLSKLQFTEQYLEWDREPVEDSATYYDFSRLQRELPPSVIIEETTTETGIKYLTRSITVEEAIASLADTIPTLFRDGKVWFYNERFLIKMKMWLDQQQRLLMSARTTALEPPVVLRDYYTQATDFKPQPNVSVFISRSQLKQWLESLVTAVQTHRIYTKIDNQLVLTREPFIFQDNDSKIYLVQNVVGGSFAKAMNVAYIWQKFKRNLGDDPPALAEPQNYPYIVYAHSSLGLVVVQDERNKILETPQIRFTVAPVMRASVQNESSTPYLRLLRFGPNPASYRYSALLELL
jgi:hypothetical protein